jgi:hypothetical protein
MAEAGILREDDRIELIEGEIIETRPIVRRYGYESVGSDSSQIGEAAFH